MVQVASYTGKESANLHVSLEYAANIDASNETIGRKSTLAVQLHFLPSLEVLRPTHNHICSASSIILCACSSVSCQHHLVLLAWMVPASKTEAYQYACTLQVTGVTFHEHHLPAEMRDTRVGGASYRAASLRRSSSLGSLDKSMFTSLARSEHRLISKIS